MVERHSRDRQIILWLVIALVIEVLLLLWHMDLVSLSVSKDKRAESETPAGFVAKSENRLHRRPLNSLIWEKSHVSEAVYYYDSLLTLEQSTATLHVIKGTEIKLLENTLVTLEPPEDGHSGEIRLKFSRGSLRTRNPFVATKIKTDEFTVDVQPGSDLKLHQVSEGNYEVQLTTGSARISSGVGDKTVQKNISPEQLVRVNQGKLSALKLDKTLKWTKQPATRIYTHSPDIEVDLRWEGQAEVLILQNTGHEEKIVKLEPSARNKHLTLEPGLHGIYLRAGNASEERLSLPLTVEVWRAPVVHLVMPLPRDRLKTDVPQDFFWARLPDASGYIFQAEGRHTNIMQKVLPTAYNTQFAAEDDVKWSVWAKDKDGFLIPPLYSYPLYIRSKPFEAPRLHTPRLRQPAQTPNKDKGAFLWKILFPKAHAAEEATYEALFTWDPVPGANRYLIEISESADFRKPIIVHETPNTEYLGKGLKKRIYYWRVAAAHTKGRMGMFSATATIAVGPSTTPPPVVVVEKPKAPEPVPPPIQAAAELKETAVIPRFEPTKGPRLYWRGGYGMIHAKAADSVNADLNGAKGLSLGFETDFFVEKSNWWSFSAVFAQTTFKPDPPQTFPYQEEISVQQAEINGTFVNSQDLWNFGFTILMTPAFSRIGAEAIEAKTQFGLGPHIQALWKQGSLEYRMNLAAIVASEGYGAYMSHRLVGKPFGPSFMVGIEADAIYLVDGEFNHMTADGFLIVGFEF